MKILKAFLDAFPNALDFEGRTRRFDFWSFVLVSNLLAFTLFLLAGEAAGWIYALVSLVPWLALSARRLHDIDRSGWWTLLGAVPLVGLILYVFWFKDGTPGTNRFGADPKGRGVVEKQAIDAAPAA